MRPRTKALTCSVPDLLEGVEAHNRKIIARVKSTGDERLDAEASGMAFLTDSGSVERNYYVDGSGRLLVNTPFEVADLYPMMEGPDTEELEFG